MTRITNLGKRKATHLQATQFESFNLPSTSTISSAANLASTASNANTEEVTAKDLSANANDNLNDAERPKPKNKKRKTHSKKKKRTPEDASSPNALISTSTPIIPGESKKEARKKTEAQKAEASQARRLARIRAKSEQTTCFACRQLGHAALDCPNSTVAPGAASAPASKGKELVGVCYRCGSFRHSLSKCKQKENPDDKLPYASCFVCGQRGHLASSCQLNSTGIYPQGGSCKLCGGVDHLARNCALSRKSQQEKPLTPAAKGTILIDDAHKVIGADDDDFHMIEKRRADMEREERVLRKFNKLQAPEKAGSEDTSAPTAPGRGVVVDPGRAALHGIEGELKVEPSPVTQIQEAVAKVKKAKAKVVKF